MQTTPKANNILGHFFALLGAVVMLAIATWVTASTSKQVEDVSSLAVPRTGHAATALSDGRVMITGGRDAAGNLVNVSEIFDPATKTSTASATLTTARVDHTATLLADGRVLIAGGTGASGALSSAEIFDPANAAAGFQAVGSAMTAARSGHTATLLNNGSVLIAGGEATGTAEIFNPSTSTFSPTLWPLTVARSGHTATLFTDDSVLLAGGNVDSMELFSGPVEQKFTLDTATMSAVRTGHWAFELSDTRLLLFQGDTGNTIDEYNPTAGTITPKGSLDFHASSSSLLANGKILVLSESAAGLYNPDAVPPVPDFTAFDETSVEGSNALKRDGQSATELSGDKKILVAGGLNAQNLFQGAALFNPARIWSDKDDYLPGDDVILSGSGWKANENVYLYAVDDTTLAWTYGTTVAADANGGFVVDPFFVVQLVQQGAHFSVSAVGAQSEMQADVKFTDANLGTVTVAPSPNPTSGTVPPGGTATYLVTVTFGGNTTPCTTNLTVTTALPAGATATFIPSSLTGANGDSPKTATLTITTTGATPVGTTNFTVNASSGSGCSGGASNGTGTLVVFGTANKLAFSQGPSNTVAGASITPAVTVQVQDSGGRLVANSSASIAMAILNNAGGGTLSGTTPVSAVNGTATFSNLSIDKVGTGYTLQATSTGLTAANSGGFNITAGTATKLAITSVNGGSNPTAGTPFSVVVQSQDANGNPANVSPATAVALSLNTGTGTLGGTLTGTINNNQNTVTISGVTYSKAESGVILTATRTSGVNLAPGNSAPFTVNAGAASRLVITGSATQTAGTSQNLTITAEDASGNTVISYTGPKLLTFSGASASSNPVTTPTVTNNTGTAVNFGTVTMITFTNGVATVSGSSNGSMTLYNVQTANIAATDGTIPASTGADRLTVTVSAGNLAKFALSLTSPQANAAVFTGTNTLTAQDSWGNTVTSFNAATDNVTIVANAPLVGTVSGLGSGANNVLNQAGNFVSGVANLTTLGMNYTGTLGTGTFTATSSTGKTGTSGNVAINAGTATQVRVETAADGSGTVVPAQTVNSGSSITVFSISRDASGNFVANVAATSWSLVSITGGVVAGDLVPAVGNKSAVFTGHAAGTAAIHASVTGLTSTDSGTITVGAGTATRLVITGSATETAGTSQNLTITAKDASGNTVTSYTGDKSLAFSGANPSTNPVTNPTVTDKTGTARNFGTATTITFTNGVATVSGSSNGSMTLYNVETVNIAANDGAGASSTGADRLTVTVSAGNLQKFALSLTSPQANGAVFTGANTLTAQDTWGNTVTGFNAATDNVTIVANAPLVGTVSGLGSGANNVLNQAGNFVNGVANLTALMKYTGTLGTGTFTATSVSGKTGTSGNVTINVGALDHFKVEAAGGGPIGTQTQNAAFNIMITAQDAGNNTVTSFSGAGSGGAVMLTSTPIGLSGAPVQTTGFTNGVLSTFSVTITNSGTFTINAAGFGGNAGKTGTSNSFTVNPSTVNTTTTVASSLNPSTYGQSVTFTATVAAASGTNNPTGTVTFTIDGTPGAPVSLGACSPAVAGTACASTSTSTLTVPGSPHTVSAAYTHTGNFVDSTGSLTGGQTVNKATPTATLSVTNSPVTYNGSPQAATVSITASSVPGAVANVKYNGSGTAPTNVATYTVTADFVPTDTANYNTLTNQSAGSFEIQKATPTATLTVTNSPVTYTGLPQAATVSISASSVPGSVANVKYNGSGTAPTNVATYTVTADFVPTDTANYNTLTDQSAGNFVIQKATPTATLTVTNSPVTYTGLPQAATVSISASSVPGSVANVKYNGSSTAPTNAATYAVTADFVPTDTANYNTLTNHSAGNFVIDKANANVVVTPYTCPGTTYNGLTHTATYTISGVNGETGAAVGTVDVTDTIHTNAAFYNGDQWTFTGTANYHDQSGTVDDCISPVTLTASIIGDPTRPYNGNTDATLTSANFSLTGLVGSESFAVTQTAGTYNNKNVLMANTVTANLASGDFTPGAGTLASNYVLPTTASGPGHISPLTLTASIINDPTRPYNGNTTATLTSANFSLTPQVGSESFTVTQTVGTYNSKDVAAANTVTASLVAGDFTPTGGAVVSNYTLPTTASGPGHISPVPLTASIIGNPTRPYNCTTVATLIPANFQLSGLVSPENFTVNQTVGAYNSKDVVSANTVTASLLAGDFTGTNGGIASNYVLPTSASGAGHITPTNASITVTAYTSPATVYNCLPHTATGSATGCDGNLSSLLDLSGTTHTNAGTYNNDPWTFNSGGTNPNYNSASGTVNDSIAKANATVTVNPYHVTYDCNPHTSTGSATGVCSDNLNSLLHLPASHTDAGDYPSDGWTFDGNTNYNATSGAVHNQIDKANTASSVTSSVNPSTIGQPVTFTTTVAGNPPVTCKPTGTVTFKDGTTTIGTGTLNPSGQATFSTSSLSAGSHSITVVYGADSNFNGSTSVVITQSVQYTFIGFFQPVDNLPILNSSKAGSVIPVKWQLKDYNGNLISDLGTLAPNGLGSQPIACDTHDPLDDIEELSAPGATVFRYDGTQFIYNWQTSKPWANTCRLLVVTLADGTVHTAQFKFK